MIRRYAVPAGILAAAAATLAVLWGAGAGDDRQARVLPTLIVGVVAGLLLIAWAAWASRKARLGIALALLAGLALCRIDGHSGDLVPILRFRWSRGDADAAGRAAPAAAFPEFRGAGRRGVVDVPIAPGPPALVWRRPVGGGWSGFAIAEGKAVTQEQDDGLECVVAYGLDGRELWRHADPARFASHVGGDGPRATPTLDGGRVYALGATGILNALDLATGRRLWSAAAGPVPEWGMSASPLVAGGRVFVPHDGLSAYDATTGARLWTAPTGGPGYASPVLIRGHVVLVDNDGCGGYDPATGARLWRHPWRGANPKVAQPEAVEPDRIVISGGYGVGAECFRVLADGRTEGVWRSSRLKAKFAPFVLRGAHLYGLDDGRIACVSAETGERAWSGPRLGHGQLLLAGDLLLVTAEGGDLVLADADPTAYRERLRHPLFDHKLWNPPALAGRHLFVRTDREAACVLLPAP